MNLFRLAMVCICLPGLGRPILAARQKTPGICDDLLPRMRLSHIPDLALATFAKGNVQTYYCSTESQMLRPRAVFEAASLSKPIFAAAVLTLIQRGTLDLDRPLAEYLSKPYEHQHNPLGEGASETVTDPRFSRITARMVLSHTSGLPNWSHHQPLTFVADPGQKWSYSGEGYVYLQRVIETITGEDLQSFVHRTIFVPFGMAHTSFIWRSDFAGELLAPHRATGLQGESQPYTHALASSTLYTTLDDYAKFVSMLLYSRPGSLGALEETKQVEVNAQLDLGWGLGVGIDDTARAAYFHWGANPGFQSFFMVQPASGRGVLFFTDSDNGLDLVDTVAAHFVPGSHPALKLPMLHPKD